MKEKGGNITYRRNQRTCSCERFV